MQADNVRMQLKSIMERQGIELVSTPFEDKKYYENIRRALVAGFFMQVAKKDSSNKNYVTVDHQNVMVGVASDILGRLMLDMLMGFPSFIHPPFFRKAIGWFTMSSC